MKAKILNIKATNNSVVKIGFQIMDDTGKVILEETRTFVTTVKTDIAAEGYIKETLKNIALQYVSETEGKLKDEATKLINKEINL